MNNGISIRLLVIASLLLVAWQFGGSIHKPSTLVTGAPAYRLDPRYLPIAANSYGAEAREEDDGPCSEASEKACGTNMCLEDPPPGKKKPKCCPGGAIVKDGQCVLCLDELPGDGSGRDRARRCGNACYRPSEGNCLTCDPKAGQDGKKVCPPGQGKKECCPPPPEK